MFAKELEEALISTQLNAGDLEWVPCIEIHRLDVALELGVDSLVFFGTSLTDERAKSDIAMAATIVLTVDTKGVKLLLSDALAEVVSDLAALHVSLH